MIIHRFALLVVVSNCLYNRETMMKSTSVAAFAPSTSTPITKSASYSHTHTSFISNERDKQLQRSQTQIHMANSHLNQDNNNDHINHSLNKDASKNSRGSGILRRSISHSGNDMSTSSSTTSLTSTTDSSDISSSFTSVMDISKIIGSYDSTEINTNDISNNMQPFLPQVDQDILSLVHHDEVINLKEHQLLKFKSLASTLVS